jgi:peptidoglycan LD-endopeptidase LytH
MRATPRAAAALLAVALLGTACTGSSGSATSTPEKSARVPTTAPPPSAAPSVSATPTPVLRRLHYAFPIRGCSASPSTSHHDYPASDIFTERGCRFVAVTSGRVDEVNRRDRWDPQANVGATRGGLSVSIVGDDGVRYYGSHLLSIARGIKPGARVRSGQTLGLVDNSGDAVGTPTHVHFGISWPTRPDAWWIRRGTVWPQRYLTAWRAGRDLSPAREVRREHRRQGDVPPCQVLC